MKGWYVIYVETGKEDCVKKWLIEQCRIEDFKVLVPKVKKYEWKQGKKNCVTKVLYKGYVLIYINMLVKNYYEIKNNPFVYQILGKGDTKSAVSYNEINILESLVDSDGIIQMTEVRFVDNEISYIDGPLCKARLLVSKVNKRKLRAYLKFNSLGTSKEVALGLFESTI